MDSDPLIRDYVLPLIEAHKTQEGYGFVKFHGTCFLIGSGGFALTNAHLLGAEGSNVLGALKVKDGEWKMHTVIQSEVHPSEDVALLKLADISGKSFLRLSSSPESSSFRYMQWSYPEEVVNELVEHGKVLNRPDLVYLEGYIRRRLSGLPLLGIRGSSFYELSEPGTVGCSGSPIIDRNGGPTWKVTGIFVGNRRTQIDNGYNAVGYAVRTESLAEWASYIIGKNVAEL
jgi:hypothetical protein